MKVTVHGEYETEQLAVAIAKGLEPNMVILLEGQLGAGKTTLTKGIAKGLGIDRIIKSPTYTLIKEYTEGDIPLYHMDLYRLEEAGDEELGLEEYFYGNGVTIVEWPAFMQEEYPEEFLMIRIHVNSETEEREFNFEPHGKKYEALLGRLKDE